MSQKVQRFLIEAYPAIQHIFTPVIPKIRPRRIHLGDAVVRVVIGQMLSAQAAGTIYARVASCARQGRLNTWELGESELRGCGLSRAKSRAITEFGAALRRDPNLVNNWRRMSAGRVTKEISAFWGMSNWTASILALFYLGHEDVFPRDDGSLKRALSLLEKSSGIRPKLLEPERACPYRSYLALYLWRALDSGTLIGDKKAALPPPRKISADDA